MSERDGRNDRPAGTWGRRPQTAWEAGGSVFDRLKHPRSSGGAADQPPLRQGDDSGEERLGTPPTRRLPFR